MKRVLMTIIVFCLAACGEVQEHYGLETLPGLERPYTINCDYCDKAAVRNAADLWNFSLGGVLFDLTAEGEVADIAIRIVEYLPRGYMGYASVFKNGDCEIELWAERIDHVPLIAHELGHCLDLNHSDDPRSIMFERVNYSSRVMPEDRDIVLNLISGDRNG